MNFKLYLSTVLILILAMGCETSSEVSRQIKHIDAQMTVSAWDLLADYEANEVAADLKYKNRIVLITGTVDRFVSHEEPLVYLDTGLGMMGVSCGFSPLEAPHVAQLNRGQRVTFKGKVTGVGLFDVEVKGCSIVETEKIKPPATIKPTAMPTTPSNLPASILTPIPDPSSNLITESESLLPPDYPKELTVRQILSLEGKGLTLKEIATTLEVLKCTKRTSISKQEVDLLLKTLRSGMHVDTGCATPEPTSAKASSLPGQLISQGPTPFPTPNVAQKIAAIAAAKLKYFETPHTPASWKKLTERVAAAHGLKNKKDAEGKIIWQDVTGVDLMLVNDAEIQIHMNPTALH